MSVATNTCFCNVFTSISHHLIAQKGNSRTLHTNLDDFCFDFDCASRRRHFSSCVVLSFRQQEEEIDDSAKHREKGRRRKKRKPHIHNNNNNNNNNINLVSHNITGQKPTQTRTLDANNNLQLNELVIVRYPQLFCFCLLTEKAPPRGPPALDPGVYIFPIFQISCGLYGPYLIHIPNVQSRYCLI